MIYEIRLKGRQKQGECSAILLMSFFIIALTVFSMNLMPLVYVSAVKPLLSEIASEKIIAVSVSALLMIISLIIYWGLSLGADRFMLKRAENVIAGAGDIFYYFAPKRVFAMTFFMTRFYLCKLGIFLLLSVPWVLCGGIFLSLCIKGFSVMVCGVFGVFAVLFLVLTLYSYSRVSDTYFLVRYRYIKGDYLNFRQLLSQSQQDMSKRCRKLRKVKLSFIGWFTLCLLILPVPYVWSYYRQTKACFAAEEY